jgi:hypothetical protein
VNADWRCVPGQLLQTQNITGFFEGFTLGGVALNGFEAFLIAGFDTFFGHDLVL